MTGKATSTKIQESAPGTAEFAAPESDGASLRQPVDPFEQMPDGRVVFEESGAALGLNDAEGELVEGIDRDVQEMPPGPLEPPTADEIVREDLARALAEQ